MTQPDLMTLAQSTYIRAQLHRLQSTHPAHAQLFRNELNQIPRPITRAQARLFAERIIEFRTRKSDPDEVQ